MNREIKFRAWDEEAKRMVFDFETTPFFASRVITKYDAPKCMQYTGLKDKNGVEIYFGDLLEVRLLAYQGQMPVHAYYEVRYGKLGGIELRIRRLFEPEELMTFLTLGDDDLDVDYRNDRYDRLAIREFCELYGNAKGSQRNEYSNNIAVIGNIYENPELLQKQ